MLESLTRALRVTLLAGLFSGLLQPALARADAAPDDPRVDFARDIRPILSDKCFACHGPDAEFREAELRLDTRSGIFDHPGRRRIVDPGKPDSSLLWQRIAHQDPERRMPPADSGKSLNDAQQALLRRWIEQGAEYREHWAFVPPVRPPVPSTPADINDDDRPANPIDSFLLARLHQERLRFSPAADPHTLVRRYSLDLTGLPPAPEEVDAFVASYARNADAACAALVDRLLHSPHFGERMAIFWLDLVRFADTVGYHGDQEHHISPYRDYVIQAFNDNLPFDRFTLEQLAGDLLPDATEQQQTASGYNRLLQTSHEGGVQQKEYLTKYSADRVRNFGSVWLGMTLGCAECHDHKYDPLPQRDFYRLAAVFADIDDLRSFKGVDGNPTRREPELDVLSEFERLRLLSLETELREALAQGTADNDPQISSLRAQIEAVQKQKRRTMITVSVPPRPIRLLSRGDWMDETGEIVEPGVPVLFQQIPAEGRATRMDLARWLTAGDHPLTARVFVNRLWKLYFGKGLASSLEDLGAQGQPPVAPELLDWLAVEFAEDWDVKRSIRGMLLSRAYRQSSFESPRLRQQDPDNRLLARQSHPRLPAELLRDQALFISGLLVHQIGGRSVRPYQPEGYYQQLNFPKRTYVADTSAQQYRRGVYAHWQRSYLHPMLKAFDAPCREECTAERAVSHTPQQALVLLNDPTFIEAARVFAVRLVESADSPPEDRLRRAWRIALSREPVERELRGLLDLYAQELAEFQADPESARQLLSVGLSRAPANVDAAELAAWTSVARVILNLNELTTRN